MEKHFVHLRLNKENIFIKNLFVYHTHTSYILYIYIHHIHRHVLSWQIHFDKVIKYKKIK
jgi:hypothetical protein